ncbi:MAG: hypothetical protein IPL49_18120 [Saprospirales bacterium]|nr:hypothetical protein [Saprospirales bacterium]
MFLCVGLFAQDRIALDNPSFEDTPRAGALPSGWDEANCGPPDQTPPDIHPNDLPPYHFFGVKLRAYEGWSYLGMVVRETGSREAVTQKLAIPLEANGRYAFSLFLARSDTYVSGIPGDAYRQADFTQPAVLQIWGGMEPCETGELLALTVPVENTSWLEYAFTLEPTQPWTYLTFEASWEGVAPITDTFCLMIAPASFRCPGSSPGRTGNAGCGGVGKSSPGNHRPISKHGYAFRFDYGAPHGRLLQNPAA